MSGVTPIPGQRRVAPRGCHLRRHDLAPLPRRRARRTARRGRLHATCRQHPARRDRDGAELDGRHHRRPDAGVLRRRDRRGTHLEPRAHAAADQPWPDSRDHERARIARPLELQRRRRDRPAATARATGSTEPSSGRTGPGWPARRSRHRATRAPVAVADEATTASAHGDRRSPCWPTTRTPTETCWR